MYSINCIEKESVYKKDYIMYKEAVVCSTDSYEYEGVFVSVFVCVSGCVGVCVCAYE